MVYHGDIAQWVCYHDGIGSVNTSIFNWVCYHNGIGSVNTSIFNIVLTEIPLAEAYIQIALGVLPEIYRPLIIDKDARVVRVYTRSRAVESEERMI